MRTTAPITLPPSRLAAALLLAGVLACGGGGDTGTEPPPPPPPPTNGYTISASSTTSSVTRGGTSTVTITVTRTGSFVGPVSLQPTGMPNGVSALANPVSVPAGQTSSTITFSATTAAALGTVPITVIGNGAGVPHQNLTIQLTVTAAPAQSGPFTLSMTATSHLIHPNNILFAFPKINVTRNPGFTGPINFTVSGLPALLAIAFTPNNSTAGTISAIPVNAGAPNGTYTATIRGASSQGEQTITFTIVVAPVSTGAIKWKFCSSASPRFFFAVKDGNGPWTRIMPSGADTSFSFTLSSGAGQVAETIIDAGGYRTTIHAFTAQEMAARAASQCALYQNVTTRTVNGSFGGVTGFRQSFVGMGWWFGSANGNGSFQLLNLPPGPLDVVAARNAEIGDISQLNVDRLLIRRGVNPATGSTLPVLDFSTAEAFPPSLSTWVFQNAGGVDFSMSQSFITAGGTTGLFTVQPQVNGNATSRTVYSVPQAQTIAGDLHQVVATIDVTGPTPGSPQRASRQIVAYSRTLANRTVSFGPPLPAPNASVLQGQPTGRLRVQGTLPPEYNSGVTFDVSQDITSNAVNSFTIHASRAFLGGGSAYDLSIPDLTAAIGWDSQFQLQTGRPAQWWVSGGGPTLDMFDGRYIFNSTRSRWTGIMTGITPPADGATYLFARATGSITP